MTRIKIKAPAGAIIGTPIALVALLIFGFAVGMHPTGIYSTTPFGTGIADGFVMPFLLILKFFKPGIAVFGDFGGATYHLGWWVGIIFFTILSRSTWLPIGIALSGLAYWILGEPAGLHPQGIWEAPGVLVGFKDGFISVLAALVKVFNPELLLYSQLGFGGYHFGWVAGYMTFLVLFFFTVTYESETR